MFALLNGSDRQARGDEIHNLVSIVMHEHKCDRPSAVGWISDLNDRLVEEVLSAVKEVPSFGNPVFDEQVSTFVEGLGNWVRAHDSWCFEVSFYCRISF